MSDLQTRLKKYEGTKEYQTKMKYYRNGKFYPYADSLGYQTIGYGHLITRGENYQTGITEVIADELLNHDILIAQNNLDTLDIWLPNDWRDFMVIMIFQLGLTGIQKFQRMLKALKERNYTEAIKQAKDSRWYKQTPNRVDQMISELTNK